VFAAMLLPWSVRNYVYEKNFSPASSQGEVSLVLNDHRMPFYGLLETNWVPYLEAYQERYPDKTERLRVLRRDFIRNTFMDPAWLARAAMWRAVAYYNLLPPGVWEPGGPGPTDWHIHWAGYNLYPLSVVVPDWRRVSRFDAETGQDDGVSGFGDLLARDPRARGADDGSEVRLPGGAIPYHPGVFAFVAPSPEATGRGGFGEEFELFSAPRLRFLGAAALSVSVFMALAYVGFGKANLFRPLREKAIVKDPQLTAGRDGPFAERILPMGWNERRAGAGLQDRRQGEVSVSGDELHVAAKSAGGLRICRRSPRTRIARRTTLPIRRTRSGGYAACRSLARRRLATCVRTRSSMLRDDCVCGHRKQDVAGVVLVTSHEDLRVGRTRNVGASRYWGLRWTRCGR